MNWTWVGLLGRSYIEANEAVASVNSM